MSRVFKLDVSESQEELELLLKKEKDARRRERLQFLYWYKTGQVTTRKALEPIRKVYFNGYHLHAAFLIRLRHSFFSIMRIEAT